MTAIPQPFVGEHNHEVRTSLGYTPEAIADLETAGAIGNAHGPWFKST